MTATISFPLYGDTTTTALVIPSRVGGKTIAMDVDYVGCHVSISRTSDVYYNVQARKGAFRGFAEATVMVWRDSATLKWVVDQFVAYGEPNQVITRTASLEAALRVAQWQVAADGHAHGAW